MQITNEREMKDFCEEVNTQAPFSIIHFTDLSNFQIKAWDNLLKIYDQNKLAELKQGIEEVSISEKVVVLYEIPGIHPFCEGCPDKYKVKSMTGVLVNCLSLDNKNVLLQLRDKNLDAGGYQYQGAAAGYGQFGIHLYAKALEELLQEADIGNPKPLINGEASAFLPFMVKSTYPQPLAVFSFVNDISQFPSCRDMKDITQFTEELKLKIQGKEIKRKEGYHFQIPKSALKSIADEMKERGMFYGPIYESFKTLM
jgi:hypothetical protein